LRERTFRSRFNPKVVRYDQEQMMDSRHSIHVFINKKRYELESAIETGASLKHLAGIPLTDVLFLQEPGEDRVIANEAKITLKDGAQLHSQPPADYGSSGALLGDAGFGPERTTMHPAPDGWSFLVIRDYVLPNGFSPDRVELLLKLPPTFPDAAPDMFWVHPAVKTPSGALPRATSGEQILGMEWQRFSWHLVPGAWKPGISTLRDYLRCIAARFLRLD
jgi:hypothetical protein